MAARGLARDVNTYKHHLAACDQTRRNDLDGRGNLSEEAGAGFANYRRCIKLFRDAWMTTGRASQR